MLSARFNQSLTMDPKGRLALPGRLWGRLDADGVRRLIFIAYGQHVRAYTLADFAKVEARFGELDAFDEAEEDRQRRILGLATEVDLDDAGRFVVPTVLRQLAGLTREVVMLSLADRVEIWDAERFAAWFASKPKVVPAVGAAGVGGPVGGASAVGAGGA